MFIRCEDVERFIQGARRRSELASYLRIEEREHNVRGLKRVVTCCYESCLGDCAAGP